jgi:hypothetical protein
VDPDPQLQICMFNTRASPQIANTSIFIHLSAYRKSAKLLGLQVEGLKVVGNEKEGGSRRWTMMGIGLGPR